MKLLSRELTKLFAQKRSYIGWGGPAPRARADDAGSVPQPQQHTRPRSRWRHQPGHAQRPPDRVAAITLLSAFLLPLLASMIGSYQLAGEAETGTIKTWLMHSVSRGGVLASKWGVAVIYVAIGLALVAVGGLIAGALAFGLHAPVLLSGQTVGIGQGLAEPAQLPLRFRRASRVLSLALLFATFTNSSLTAANRGAGRGHRHEHPRRLQLLQLPQARPVLRVTSTPGRTCSANPPTGTR